MTPLAAGVGYGHFETELGEGRYKVGYLTPVEQTWLGRGKRAEDAESARSLAHDLAMLRAARLAVEQGHAGFKVSDTQTDVEVNVVEDVLVGIDPFFGTALGDHNSGSPHFHYIAPSFRSAWLRAQATLVVDMRDDLEVDDLDAAATIARLEGERAQALLPR